MHLWTRKPASDSSRACLNRNAHRVAAKLKDTETSTQSQTDPSCLPSESFNKVCSAPVTAPYRLCIIPILSLISFFLFSFFLVKAHKHSLSVTTEKASPHTHFAVHPSPHPLNLSLRYSLNTPDGVEDVC